MIRQPEPVEIWPATYLKIFPNIAAWQVSMLLYRLCISSIRSSFKTEKVFLDVDCSDGAGRGATLCDFRWWLHEEDEMKDMILTDADTESFQQELFEAIYSVSECRTGK